MSDQPDEAARAWGVASQAGRDASGAVPDGAARTWSVILPPRGAASRSGARPRATLVVSAGGAETRRELPLAVGRALVRLAADPSAQPLPAELEDIVRKLEQDCARRRVASLLDRRDYSAREVRERLVRDGYVPAVCDAAVARAVACGLIDDGRYADVLIRSKLASGWGQRRIERELARRGVDASTLVGWPEAYLSPDDEQQRALALARTRRLATKNAYEKLVRYLAGRGYSLSLSMRVARQVVDESGAASDA